MNKQIKLTPYVSFEGNCEEAFNYYKNIFEGSDFEVVQRYDALQMQAPENYKHKVLHGHFNFGTDMFFGADVFPGSMPGKNSNIALSFDVADPEEGKKIFSQLADGGKVGIDFQKQFWGDWHGNLMDRFGVRWMVNCGNSK